MKEFAQKNYIENLPTTINTEKVVSNMKKIYKEIQTGVIEKVDAYLNNAAWEKQNRIIVQNPNHIMNKSVCVILTLKVGKSLVDVGLKHHCHEYKVQRTVRPWMGLI